MADILYCKTCGKSLDSNGQHECPGLFGETIKCPERKIWIEKDPDRCGLNMNVQCIQHLGEIFGKKFDYRKCPIFIRAGVPANLIKSAERHKS